MVRSLAILGSLLLAAATAPLQAAPPQVEIVTGPQPSDPVAYAAQMLSTHWQALYHAEVSLVETPAAKPDYRLLLGNPQTNPALARAIGTDWPQQGAQGVVVRVLKNQRTPTVLVGGQSAAAVLWAAAILDEQLGVRYLLHGDQYPPPSAGPDLSGVGLTAEPTQEDRSWVVYDPSPAGLGGWSLAELEPLLGQLAKLRFNRVVLQLTEDWPFVPDDAQPGRPLLVDERFPVTGDTAGRRCFGGAKFWTPGDFAGARSVEDWEAAGKAFLGGMERASTALGLSATVDVASAERLAAGEGGWTFPGLLPAPGLAQSPLRATAAPGIVAVHPRHPGDLDPLALYLARASFEVVPAAEAVAFAYEPFCGGSDVAGRLQLAYDFLAQAEQLQTDQDQSALATPRPDLLNDLLSAERGPSKELVEQLLTLHTNSMNEFYRAHDNASPAGRPVIYYHCMRGEFALYYLSCVQALVAAREAAAAGDSAEALAQHETALEMIYSALNQYSQVARDASDRGTIAVLNAWLYRPLQARIAELSAE